MHDLTDVKNFYSSFLGRLFFVISLLITVLSATIIFMQYQNHMTQVDEKIRVNSEFLMGTSVNQLEQHLAVFALTKRHIEALPSDYTNTQLKQLSDETLANFPNYVEAQFYLLEGPTLLRPMYHQAGENPAQSPQQLGFTQRISFDRMLLGTPKYFAQDGTLRLPMGYLTRVENLPMPVMMLVYIDLNSSYNPWQYNLIDKDMEILVTKKSHLENDEYWMTYFSAPASIYQNPWDVYSKPMPSGFIDTVNKNIIALTGRSVDKMTETDGTLIYSNHTQGLSSARVGVSYNKQFNTFLALRVHLQGIYADVVFFALWVGGLGLFVMSLGYFTAFHLYRVDLNYKNKLFHQANFDPLTQLANRHFFDKSLQQVQQQHLGDYGLLCIDLDSFKHMNDRFGRELGDKVLVYAAGRIAQSVPKGAAVVRSGSDEFFVLLQGKSVETCESVAKDVLEAIKAPMDFDNLHLSITASIGIYMAEESAEQNVAETYAGIAMFEAKKLKDRYCVFDKSLADRIHHRVDIETELKNAIANSELTLNYQPQVCSRTEEVKGVEVLLRWHNKKLGFVSPAEFIPIAEETGLIAPIGEYVINQAFADYAQYLQGSDVTLSINVSAYQLMYTPLFFILRDAVEQFSIRPEKVVLEVTESIFIEDKETVQELLDSLIGYGFLVSLDDFGTGYSSLSQMRDYPIHELKIDRSFIINVHQESQDAALLHQIVSIAKCQNITTVAEGVENQAQHEIVQALGIDLEQGYLFAKPMSIKQLHDFVSQGQGKLEKIG